ncbi:MAG: dipeptide/oligopeptide/nickel ABC transporter permease/ATP-binding protein [Acidimicrobiales bacterium]
MTRWRSLRPGTRALAIVGFVMLLTLLGAAVLADVLAVHPPDRASGPPFARPSGEHLLGTDDLGRDLWAQLLHGARTTLAIGLSAAAFATMIGTVVALVAGWFGGWVDAVLMRIVDLTLAVPFLVLILVLASYFGRGALVTAVLLTGVLWARPARLLRSQVLKLRHFGHVVAADVMGAGTDRVLRVHILRRLVPLLLSQFVRAAAVAVIVQSGVAFLGLGDPNRVSWGSTLFFANNGNAVLTDAWLWWIVPPGMALTLLVVGLAFVGLAAEELVDPGITNHGWRPGITRTLSDEPVAALAPGTTFQVQNFSVSYDGNRVVDEVEFTIGTGRVVGLVGESGSGKSSLILGLLGLLPSEGRVEGGSALLAAQSDSDEIDLRRLGRAGLAELRGRRLALVPQAAMSLLDPTMTVLRQVQESAELTVGRTAAKDRAAEVLTRVGIADHRHDAFPHQLSGGQRQRVIIAMALTNDPQLLIADEPTTGLDVITQTEILDLLDELRNERGLDVLLISHDLPMIAARSDDLAIMYAGRIVEVGPTQDLLAEPTHPYTEMLAQAFPALDGSNRKAEPIPGEAPTPGHLGPGCSFAPRCPQVESICTTSKPPLISIGDGPADRAEGRGRAAACHLTRPTAAATADASVTP